VIVIGRGQVLADSPFQVLRDTVLRERRLTLEFATQAPAIEWPGVTVVSRSGATLVLSFDPSQTKTPELIARASRDQAVLDVHVERPAIEEVIARFYDLHGAAEG
jgi:ABC-2 type transport system ATP-binding protein